MGFGAVLILTAIGLVSPLTSGQAVNGSNCAVSLKSQPSDPASQSGIASILLTSTVDASLEFLCSSGSNYDNTGISCYALKCPAPPSYGPYGGQQPGQPGYGQPGYGQPAGPYGAPNGGGYGGSPVYGGYGRQGLAGPISVGQKVAYVETAYGCWKLRQIRLNTYVYLVCFTKGYPSTLYQVVFKENGLDLVNYDAIPYNQLTAVGRGSFTAENQFLCVAAVYSSYGPSYARGDHVYTQPSDQLAPIYVICPNNYKWYFCGNVNIKDTLDVSVWYAQSTLHAIFVQLQEENSLVPGNSTLAHCSLTPIIQYTITPDIENYVCASQLESKILAVGPAVTEESPNNHYILRGVQTCTIVANNNATLLCCAVDRDHGCPTDPPTAQHFSSFCIPYDTNSNRFLTERVVFLIGSEHATDIQLIRANGECCQFILTNGPAQSLHLYSLQTIIANLNNLTNPDPVSITPADLGDEKLFHDAVSCSSKVKGCGSSSTLLTCVRPAKFAEKYLAQLSCPSGRSNSYQYSDTPGYDETPVYGAGLAQVQGAPYAAGPQPLQVAGVYGGGRPANYSSPVLAYGPPQPQPQYIPGPVYGPPQLVNQYNAAPQQHYQAPPQPLYQAAPPRY